MPNSTLLRIAVAASFLSGNAIAAPPEAPTTAPLEALTKAPAASPIYDSAFAGYRSTQAIANPPSLDDWRQANDTVARIGGHAGVMRDMTPPPSGGTAPTAETPSSTPPPAAIPQTPPATDPHHGHGGAR